MTRRTDDRLIVNNRHNLYKRKLKDRGLKSFRHFLSPRFRNVTEEDLQDIETVEILWHPGDRLYKLSHRYYGDPTYWWIIAWFNEKPTDAHFEPGDPVVVPLPLDHMIGLFSEGS